MFEITDKKSKSIALLTKNFGKYISKEDQQMESQATSQRIKLIQIHQNSKRIIGFNAENVEVMVTFNLSVPTP